MDREMTLGKMGLLSRGEAVTNGSLCQ